METNKADMTLEDFEIELEDAIEFGPNVQGPRRDIGGPGPNA